MAVLIMKGHLSNLQRTMDSLRIPEYDRLKAFNALCLPKSISATQHSMELLCPTNSWASAKSLSAVSATQRAMESSLRILDSTLAMAKSLSAISVAAQCASDVGIMQKGISAFCLPVGITATSRPMDSISWPKGWEAAKSLCTFQIPDYISKVQGDLEAHRLAANFLEAQSYVTPFLSQDFDWDMRGLASLAKGSLFDLISPLNWPLAYDYDLSEFGVSDGGAITVGSEEIDYNKVREIINRITKESFDKAAGQFEQTIKGIVSSVNKVPDSKLKKFIISIVFQLIVGLIVSCINPFPDYFIKAYLENKKQAAKLLKKNALAVIGDTSQLKQYRLITRERELVRLRPYPKSTVIHKVFFGQVVIVLTKRKDWTLVAWSDDADNDFTHTGWIRSKYLSKF